MTAPEEDALADMKLDILEEKRDYLCNNLTPKDHYPYLRSRFILSEDDQEEIEAEKTRRHKASRFLDILRKKGRQAFDELIKSIIEERTQMFIATDLNKAYEDKVKRVRALLSNQDLLNQNGHGQQTKITREKIDQSRISQSQYRHSYPQVGGLSEVPSNRDSISDLGVDTEKLPKPVKKNKNPAFTDNKSDIKPCPPEILTMRENSVEEHEMKDSSA